MTRKIQEWFGRLGGSFGTLLVYDHDFMDSPKAWEESLARLAKEVAPKLAG